MQCVPEDISTDRTGGAGAQFPLMLSPGRIGEAEIANRVIMGAMHTRFETLDRALEREIAFYRARVEGGVGAIISGGFSPDLPGRFEPDALVMHPDHLDREYQRALTSSVCSAGAPFFAQLLHAGRYAHSADCVGASGIRSPINKFMPRALETTEVEEVVEAFANAAEFAIDCGYVGVEIMGSEGYLINQFLAPRTNSRDDRYGGAWANRKRFAVDIIRRIRRRIGRSIPLIFRISVLDLVEDGMTRHEVFDLARTLEDEGVDAFNTGVGWHESRVPTVAQITPRAAFAKETAALRGIISAPVIASNRINDPHIAETLLKNGDADFISLSRQMLSDPDFVRKAKEGRADRINTCIACNQACLDRIFIEEPPSCLVNPRAGREIEFPNFQTRRSLRVAVIGGGVAGMAAAAEAAERGHDVTLFEQQARLGGLLNLARMVPGKGEFGAFLRYLTTRLGDAGVNVRLSIKPTFDDLHGFNEIIDATGVSPRPLNVPGANHPCVATYEDILSRAVIAGRRCVIVGAGGIGVDTAEYLLEPDYQMAERGAFA
ncbi:MAG: FAD-dependent oxidoreductase, partial [Pseudomonadota bacterium]